MEVNKGARGNTPSTAMREERKVVTAVFADLAGSTALGERLDPEEIKLVVGEAVARIVTAIEDFGGTVKDLAGDGVLALFGAPVAHEDDAERAVLAGLRITRDIRAYGEEVARAFGLEGFGVRVGIHTGPVVLGPIGAGSRVEYAAFGDTVNTAARLQSAARPGAALVSEETRRRIEPLFRWNESRPFELKGKAEPVLAAEVLGPAPGAGKARGLPGVQTQLVGREREVAESDAALREVLAGSGGILFVTGEPGIGKSRLLQEIRHRFESAPPIEGRGEPLWLEGRCVSYGEALPYWPFRDLLRDWLGVGADDPELKVRIALRRHVDALFGPRAGEIAPYLGAMLGLALEPEDAGRLAELSPEALQYRTFEVVRHVVERLAGDRPLAVALDDLHWADATSIQLAQQLLAVTEDAAVLLVVAARPERDHPWWQVKEEAARRFPHRTRELALDALSADADRELLAELVGHAPLPTAVEEQVLGSAEGNPFFLEELIRSLIDAGAVLPGGDGRAWRFDHAVNVEIPPTVEKVILARIDRLSTECHDVLTAASVLGRRFGLPLLEGVAGGNGRLRESLTELQRLDLIREGRRWPQPEYRFKHALIQEAAYRTLLTDQRSALHRRAAEWLERRHGENEGEVLGLLAHHWLAANDEGKAIAYLTQAGDRARQEYALDEAIGHYQALLPLLERRGERQAGALVLFKLALALHTSMRFAEANAAYQRGFDHWVRPEPFPGTPTATLRVATSFLPNDPDPKSAIAWPNIQLCMQLFDRLVEQWPERTIVPSLAERWEIADDGLRYLFRLREGLLWSDGHPLTAGDVEFGIKQVLDPDSPGSSVAIYFVLENAQDYYLGRHRDAERIGVKALDDRTIEFRLAAPAPYFMSVMNRPDGGPQPRHAIERLGERWTDPEVQVVSGAFRVSGRTENEVILTRRPEALGPGNVGRVTLYGTSIADALAPYERDEVDMILVRYTPRLNDLVPDDSNLPVATVGPATWSAYLRFDHTHPIGSNLELRRALAHAIDRRALATACPENLVVATGGVVPPALQGHTPDIAPRFDPDLARKHMANSGFAGELELAGMTVWNDILPVIAASWEDVFGQRVRVRTWSWQAEEAMHGGGRPDAAYLRITGWFPGYPDPEYFLRLLFQSDSRTNEGAFSWPPFDELIERARRERSDRARLELFHEADRMAVADRVACIPLVYGRNMAYVQPRVRGWWEFGKTSAAFADLMVEPNSSRP